MRILLRGQDRQNMNEDIKIRIKTMKYTEENGLKKGTGTSRRSTDLRLGRDIVCVQLFYLLCIWRPSVGGSTVRYKRYCIMCRWEERRKSENYLVRE